MAKLTEEVPIDGIPYIVYTDSLRKSTYKVATLAQLLWRENADPVQDADIQRLAAMPITEAIKSILNDYRYTSRVQPHLEGIRRGRLQYAVLEEGGLVRVFLGPPFPLGLPRETGLDLYCRRFAHPILVSSCNTWLALDSARLITLTSTATASRTGSIFRAPARSTTPTVLKHWKTY